MKLQPDNVAFKDPLLDVFCDQFSQGLDAFRQNPRFEGIHSAEHLSDAAREQFMHLNRLTRSQARTLLSLMENAATTVQDAFPSTADQETDMPNQYATHFRRQAATLRTLLDEVGPAAA